MRRCQYHELLGKCKLKLQDSTTQLLEWEQLKVYHLSIGEDKEQPELSCIARQNVEQCSHFGRQFDSFLKS